MEILYFKAGDNLISVKIIVNIWKTVKVNFILDSSEISQVNVNKGSSLVLNGWAISILEIEVPLFVS